MEMLKHILHNDDTLIWRHVQQAQGSRLDIVLVTVEGKTRGSSLSTPPDAAPPHSFIFNCRTMLALSSLPTFALRTGWYRTAIIARCVKSLLSHSLYPVGSSLHLPLSLGGLPW